jgi:hypothetical protein
MAAKHVVQSGVAALVLSLVVSGPVRADEGGLSFWLPGLFGGFAAAPGQPGLSVATFYYHALASASEGKEFFRGDKIVAGVQGRGDLVGVPIVPFAAVEHQPIGHRGKRLAGAWEKLCEQDLRANVALVGIGALGHSITLARANSWSRKSRSFL